MKRYWLISIVVVFVSCKKQDNWLDIKANKADVVPKTLTDFQAILDNDAQMNNSYPGLPVIASDNLYYTYAIWQAANLEQERNSFIWTDNIYNGVISFDWNSAYSRVAYANVVLEGLSKIPETYENKTQLRTLTGAALFHRAHSFFDLAQEFAQQYDNSVPAGLGIPLRLSTDVNELSTRSSLQETYDQIIRDLQLAESMLPITQQPATRPNKAAANGLLARVYLNMSLYDKAADCASKALNSYSILLDYNTINSTPAFPFPTLQTKNVEVIYYATTNSFGLLSNSRMLVDTLLYNSYAGNDLRKDLFYKNNGVNGISYRGYYTGVNSNHFSGIATNELYLIKAECLARQGNTTAALSDLNALLKKRWKTGTFTPIVATTTSEALVKILIERRKELPFVSTLRWQDLRRLNKEPQFAITISRVLNGQNYLLLPNSLKYVFPIGDDEIRLSGIQQNPR